MTLTRSQAYACTSLASGTKSQNKPQCQVFLQQQKTEKDIKPNRTEVKNPKEAVKPGSLYSISTKYKKIVETEQHKRKGVRASRSVNSCEVNTWGNKWKVGIILMRFVFADSSWS